MSSNLAPDNLRDTDCKKGHVTQRPPGFYTLVKSILSSSSIESIKVKLPSGDLMKVPLLVDTLDPEIYVKHLSAHDCLQFEKGLDVKLQATSKANVAAWKPVRKIGIVPVCESNKAKAERLLEVFDAEDRAEKAQAEASTVAGLCYDLFRKLLKDEPQTQWDCRNSVNW